ncbi:hypothetical protein B0T25DRAFT_467056 [Lasiosphaeria hispida]|uniref:Uncharacterized protein n=1 Tax=Lasiosphaeria hispida TaxID=260671 RepID=A0AAJ0M7L0_9PEZI|nr:hypothetical protein B0T25DRAFT_467056 [Lasiosphaeria hispida]
MRVQFEPLNQRPFEQYGPWHFHDSRFQEAARVDLGAALLQVAALPVLNDRLCELSRAGRAQLHNTSHSIEEFSPLVIKSSKPIPQVSVKPILSSKLSALPTAVTWKPKVVNIPQTTSPNPVFACLIPLGKPILSFPIKEVPASPKPPLKRRRPDTDVDGFNTAGMGCKKRRLLRQLVTSRLSHPFSSPATHIRCRESAVSGDRRYMRIAAIVATRRQHSTGAVPAQQSLAPHPSPSSMLRRAAVINRFRLRIRSEAGDNCDVEATDLTADPVVSQSQSPSAVRLPMASEPQVPPPSVPVVRISYETPPHPLNRARVQMRASPPGSPAGLRPTEPTAPSLRLPPSPCLRPLRSPELRSSRPAIDLDEDDLDDESVAFPTSEHESRYGDEPDDVYADFGVIFGGGEDDTSDDEPGEHFEDYLDDLDGIPWNARC